MSNEKFKVKFGKETKNKTEKEILDKLSSKKYDVVCMGCIVTGYKIVKDLCIKIKIWK